MNFVTLVSSARTTVVHVRDAHDVYIGRAMPGRTASEFQNPFRIGRDGNRTDVLRKFRVHLHALIASDPSVADRLKALKGKRLGCWCKPYDCHGDTLAEWLDGEAPSVQMCEPPQLLLF